MDRQPAPTLTVLGPKPPDPGDDRRHVVRPAAGGDVGAEVDQGVPAGIARWPYQVRRRPMATSSLTTGSSR